MSKLNGRIKHLEQQQQPEIPVSSEDEPMLFLEMVAACRDIFETAIQRRVAYRDENQQSIDRILAKGGNESNVTTFRTMVHHSQCDIDAWNVLCFVLDCTPNDVPLIKPRVEALYSLYGYPFRFFYHASEHHYPKLAERPAYQQWQDYLKRKRNALQ